MDVGGSHERSRANGGWIQRQSGNGTVAMGIIYESDDAELLPTRLDAGLPNGAHRIVAVALDSGLNLRASAIFAETASDFGCNILVRDSERMVDGKGILSVLSLGADTGTLLEITAHGPGATSALDILAGLATHEGKSFFSLVDPGGGTAH